MKLSDYLKLTQKKKPAKYKNKIVKQDDITFHSSNECSRYGTLKLLLRAGHIRDLKLQVRFKLEVCGMLICTYVADFVYFDLYKAKEIVEDFKGFLTPEYKLKKKLMKAIHDIDILETGARRKR